MNQQVLEIQAKTIEQMKSIQSQTLEINERIADTVTGMMPELPELPEAWTDNVPQPTELVTNWFDFLGELRQANREFVQAMTAAWFPAEAKKASKATAKK